MQKKYLLLISCLTMVGCNSGGSSSTPVKPIDDLTLDISTPLQVSNSSNINQVCLSPTSPLSKGSMLTVDIASTDSKLAAVYPSSCTLIYRVGGICCRFQTTALAPGVVSISASSAGHQTVSQNLAIIATDSDAKGAAIDKY